MLSISDLIVLILPNELAIRYYKKAEHGSPASGKLFNAYHNQRSELSKINIITLRPKTKRLKVSHEDKAVKSLTPSESLLFLTSYIDPWDKVVDSWKISYSERLKLLENSKLSTAAYLERFPCFSENKFSDLVRILLNLNENFD